MAGASDATPAGETFEEVASRLDQIVGEVKAKDTSLERSLDLLDEAIELGNRAVELVDSPQLSAAERAAAERGQEGRVGDE